MREYREAMSELEEKEMELDRESASIEEDVTAIKALVLRIFIVL